MLLWKQASLHLRKGDFDCINLTVKFRYWSCSDAQHNWINLVVVLKELTAVEDHLMINMTVSVLLTPAETLSLSPPFFTSLTPAGCFFALACPPPSCQYQLMGSVFWKRLRCKTGIGDCDRKQNLSQQQAFQEDL